MIAAAALTVAALGTLAHGAYYRNSPVFGRALGSLPATQGERLVALTFDDGPNPEATPRILDALAEADVSATFFLLGRHVDRWPGIARRIATDGHTIANHGWHHRKLHSALPARVRLDLEMHHLPATDARICGEAVKSRLAASRLASLQRCDTDVQRHADGCRCRHARRQGIGCRSR